MIGVIGIAARIADHIPFCLSLGYPFKHFARTALGVPKVRTQASNALGTPAGPDEGRTIRRIGNGAIDDLGRLRQGLAHAPKRLRYTIPTGPDHQDKAEN